VHIDPRFLLGLKRVPLHLTMAGLNREVQTTYPELGSNFKAAHVKIVACFMAHLVNEVMMLRDAHGKSIATMFWGMADLLHTLDTSPRWLSAEQINRAQRAGGAYLLAYQSLATEAMNMGKCLYKMKPKFHYMCHHVMELESGWNPRFQHCFNDEDFMGKLHRLGSHCHRKSAPLRILQRWALFIANRWEKRRRIGVLRV
jgi:hypothetical protein